MPNLVELHLWQLPLEYLHRDTFKTNLKLNFIDLDSNKLTMIHHKTFSHLSNLITLYLQGNNCIYKRFQNNPDKITIESELLVCSSNYWNDGRFKQIEKQFEVKFEENSKQIAEIKTTIKKIQDKLNQK